MEQLFNARGSSIPSVYEPRSLPAARAAVRRLGELLEQLPGSVADALEAAGSSGELLSSDRLQGLAEILQNADDTGASEVRLLLRDDDLLMSHNGEEMRLHHVLGVAMPWFSTKRAESGSLGRFGIGLSALRSISSMIEVHYSPYHVRLGQPIPSSIDPAQLPAGFDEEGGTVFRVLLTEGEVEFEELADWIERWGGCRPIVSPQCRSSHIARAIGRHVMSLVGEPGRSRIAPARWFRRIPSSSQTESGDSGRALVAGL